MSTVQQAIVEVMREVTSVGKNEKNQAQGFKFRGIDAVMNAVGPAFRKHGCFIVPEILEKQAVQVPSKNGGALNVVRLTVAYSIHSSAGDSLTGIVCSEAFDSGDKATAKALSVAMRSFLLQVLCLPTDEPDPDHAVYEVAVAGPTVNELKLQISKLMKGKSPLEIREHITNVTGKADNWSAVELAGVLDGLI